VAVVSHRDRPTDQPTKYMEESLSSESNSSSAGQEILCLLWKPKLRYHVHKSPLLVPIPRQMPIESPPHDTYSGVSKSVRTGHLERELQMVQLSASRYIVSLFCGSVLWVLPP